MEPRQACISFAGPGICRVIEKRDAVVRSAASVCCAVKRPSGGEDAARLSRRRALAVIAACGVSSYLRVGAVAAEPVTEPGQGKAQADSIVTTPTGLRYYDFPPSKAAEVGERVGPGDKVRFHLTTGTTGARNGWVIDSTHREGRDALIVVVGSGEVVAGLDEALLGIPVGGKRRALVPPKLGYVREGMQPAVKGFAETQRFRNLFYNKDRQYIPDVVFDIEVLKILKKG